MSSNKTSNLNLHSWVGTDKVLRNEFVYNFEAIDNKFNASDGHSHNGEKGQGEKIDSNYISYDSNYSVKEKLDELFQSANSTYTTISEAIGDSTDLGDNDNLISHYWSIPSRNKTCSTAIRSFKNAISNKYGAIDSIEKYSLGGVASAIKSIPYNLAPQGDAVSSDVANGKTFINATGNLVTGSARLIEDTTYIPKTTQRNIPEAIHVNSKIAGEPNLTPENIRYGATIYGVTGTFEAKRGYNPGDLVDVINIVPKYEVIYTEDFASSKVAYEDDFGYLWTVKKYSSYQEIRNQNSTNTSLIVGITDDILSMVINFNGFYIRTLKSIYCFDYKTFKHKWTINLSDIVSSSDTVVAVHNNHLGELIVICQKGKIFILDHKDGTVKDSYLLLLNENTPVNITKTKQDKTAQAICLIDNTNGVVFSIDSDLNADNLARVIKYKYALGTLEVKDVIPVDADSGFLLVNNIYKPNRTYIMSYESKENTAHVSDGSIEDGSIVKFFRLVDSYDSDRDIFVLLSNSNIYIYDTYSRIVVLTYPINMAASYSFACGTSVFAPRVNGGASYVTLSRINSSYVCYPDDRPSNLSENTKESITWSITKTKIKKL